MGANAQTTVPTFTAGAVLTAAQMNTSARTGIPVFATTTTRDAAFGSSPLKTLAEGQLCYIEASDIVQYYDGSAWRTLAPVVDSINTAEVSTLQNTTSNTYVDLATVGPTVTVTTGTKVLVFLYSTGQSPGGTSGNARMSFAISGATTLAADFSRSLSFFSGNGVATAGYSSVIPVTVTAGSNTFTAKYTVDNVGGTAGFANRRMIVMTYV